MKTENRSHLQPQAVSESLSTLTVKTQNSSYLDAQGVSEGLSTLIVKEISRCVFLEGSGSAKVMSSDENFTGPYGFHWIFEKYQIL